MKVILGLYHTGCFRTSPYIKKWKENWISDFLFWKRVLTYRAILGKKGKLWPEPEDWLYGRHRKLYIFGKRKALSFQKCSFPWVLRERPLFCALFTIRTMFGLILTHPPTIQFEHRGQINAHTLKDTFVFKILVHVS